MWFVLLLLCLISPPTATHFQFVDGYGNGRDCQFVEFGVSYAISVIFLTVAYDQAIFCLPCKSYGKLYIVHGCFNGYCMCCATVDMNYTFYLPNEKHFIFLNSIFSSDYDINANAHLLYTFHSTPCSENFLFLRHSFPSSFLSLFVSHLILFMIQIFPTVAFWIEAKFNFLSLAVADPTGAW